MGDKEKEDLIDKVREKRMIIFNSVKNKLEETKSSSELPIKEIIEIIKQELEDLNILYEKLGSPLYVEHYIVEVLENICLEKKIVLKEKREDQKITTIIFKDREAELILFLMKYYNSTPYAENDHNIILPLLDENKILNYFDLDSSFIYKIEKLGICSNNNTERIIKFGNYKTNYFSLKDRKYIEQNISARIEIDRIISLKELTKNSKNKIEELEKNTENKINLIEDKILQFETKILSSEKRSLKIENKISSFEKSLTKVEKLISNAENDIDSFHKSVEKTKFDLVAVLGVFVCIFTLISVNVNTTKSFFESEVKFDVVMTLLYSNWVMIFSLGTLVLFIKYILVYSRKENSVLIGLFLWLIMFIGTSLIYYLLKTDFLKIIQHYNFLILNK